MPNKNINRLNGRFNILFFNMFVLYSYCAIDRFAYHATFISAFSFSKPTAQLRYPISKPRDMCAHIIHAKSSLIRR